MAATVDPVTHDRIAWNLRTEADDKWSRPVAAAVVERARQGEWAVSLTGYAPVDPSWFPSPMSGADVFCLAGAGGQQGSVLAAVGARVTVLDNSPAPRPRPEEKTEMNRFQDGSTITSRRLGLAPLQVSDADSMVEVLADERIHEFIGGRPASLAELRARYQDLVEGSGDEKQLWLNWIVRRCEDGRAVGTLQATVTRVGSARIAEIAWVIGVEWQQRGYASEAAQALVTWLSVRRVGVVTANIRADHHASATVATRAGLIPTAAWVDGERIWRLTVRP